MLRTVARIIAPTHCMGCNIEGELICKSCWQNQIKKAAQSCVRCNSYSVKGATCASCAAFTPLAGLVFAGEYAGALRQLIQLLKYHRQRDAAAVLARSITPLLCERKHDVITAVPVATTRLRLRGYNQSELIARQMARRLGLPCRPLLRRLRNVQQVGKTRAERLRQVEGAFAARGRVAGQSILIIDDVMTTGATLAECARALRAAGAASVWAAVAARD